jgi:hypothetical protein
MRLRIGVEGDFQGLIDEETTETSRRLRDGVRCATDGLREDLRSQTATALPRGRGIANAWRAKVFPANPFTVTLHPAGLVWSRAPNIIDAFDKGAPITAKRSRYLCWPTGFNAVGGRRNAGARGGLRVTAAEMAAARGQAVVIPSRTDRSVFLWCLRVRQASSTGGRTGRGRGRLRLFVGNRNVEVNTGRGKASDKAARSRLILKNDLVPMFYLKKTVSPGKRLDVAGAARRAETALAAHVASEMGRN